MSEPGKPRRSRLWTPSNMDMGALFGNLGMLIDYAKEDKQAIYYLIGLVLASLPDDTRQEAMEFAGRFVLQCTEGYNKQLDRKGGAG